MTTTQTRTETTAATNPTGERADLLAVLAKHRFFLRNTLRDLTEEQASQRTTVSELNLAGLIKHVAAVEQAWMRFVLGGAEAMEAGQAEADWANGFRLVDGETLAGALEHYEEVAKQTDEIVASLPDLDVSRELPKAPWFEPGARWSARRVLLHLIAEIAQHSGHADIIRESLDGAKSMG
ncbi:DinB family protein [Amycolatopsis nigrescens]|uniref:DinB family protein n=1 Tax=Amycolatopsis nigrescens TaxID=381445 RepID=UPI00035F89CE|nr:DinB family protein [Amycolatopsis nigrescens]